MTGHFSWRACYACCAVLAVSPFDLALPANGFTQLYIRPLMIFGGLVGLTVLIVSWKIVDVPIAMASGALVCSLGLATLLSDDATTGFSVTLRLTILVVLYLASSAAFRSPADEEILAVVYCLSAAVASVVGLAVLAHGGDYGWTSHLLGSVSITRGVDRLTRPFSQANIAAMYLGPGLMMGVGLLATRKRFAGKLLFGSAVAVTVVALSLTLSRGTNLVVGAVLVWLSAQWLYEKRAKSALFTSVVIAALLSLFLLSDSWQDRLAGNSSSKSVPMGRSGIWRQGIEAWIENPISGLGPGLFGRFSLNATEPPFVGAPHAHNLLLELLATGGAIVVIPLVALAFLSGRQLWRGRSNIQLAAAPVAVLLLHSLVDYPLVYSSSGNAFAIVLGSAVGLAGDYRDQHA